MPCFKYGALLSCLSILLAASSVSAAELSVIDTGPSSPAVVFLTGDIVEGDAAEFDRLTGQIDRAIVFLKSNGGLVREALAIGSKIRLRGFSTSLPGDTECYSACALIWVAGSKRYLSPSSTLGVHAAYIERDGGFSESGVANAEIGAYLAHLGLRIEAIRFFTASGPNSFLFITPSVARTIGIDLYVIEDGVVTTPQEAPTVDQYAEVYISVMTLRVLCTGFFQADGGVLDSQSRLAEEAGLSIVDPDSWAELWMRAADEIKGRIAADGGLKVCLETESSLRLRGIDPGVYGPSYQCTGTETGTETAICASPVLWAKDRAMNAIYLEMRKLSDTAYRKSILAEQRAWMARRNACGQNAQCIAEAYDHRLQDFRDIQIRPVP